jgi:pyruvate dehydrogenase E2 component (dihydrolipoamide acetyltransferase)
VTSWRSTSPYAGTVVETRGEPGETLTVGSLLLRVETAASAPAGVPAPPERDPDRPERKAVLVGYGVDDDADRSRRRAAGAAAAAQVTSQRSGRALAKPPVRQLARTLRVDLAALAPGSGPDGIITRRDVTRAAQAVSGVDGPAPSLEVTGRELPGPRPPTVGHNGTAPSRGDGELVPVHGVRARMAERMAASRTRIPDAHCSVTVDCTRLLEVRARLCVAAEAEGAAAAVTPFALILRLVVASLRHYPLLNSAWVDDGPAIRRHSAIHLGFGAATPRGLLVPVIKNAQWLSTLELAVEAARLVGSARAGSLTPAELSGSTFTVSNFGALGLDEGVPVINYPEAAILGVGLVKPRPFVLDGGLAVRPTATLSCAFDHRVADGAEAAAFLCELRDLIETPELALLRAVSEGRAAERRNDRGAAG